MQKGKGGKLIGLKFLFKNPQTGIEEISIHKEDIGSWKTYKRGRSLRDKIDRENAKNLRIKYLTLRKQAFSYKKNRKLKSDKDSRAKITFNKALEHIYIGGQRIKYPKRFSNLGKDFTLGGVPVENEWIDKYVFDGISSVVSDDFIYKGYRVGRIILRGNLENHGNDSEVLEIELEKGSNKLDFGTGVFHIRLDGKSDQEGREKFFGNKYGYFPVLNSKKRGKLLLTNSRHS